MWDMDNYGVIGGLLVDFDLKANLYIGYFCWSIINYLGLELMWFIRAEIETECPPGLGSRTSTDTPHYFSRSALWTLNLRRREPELVVQTKHQTANDDQTKASPTPRIVDLRIPTTDLSLPPSRYLVSE